MKRCEALKGDGARCQGRVMEGSDWCYNHDPSKAEERRRNARRGGKTGGRGRSGLDETAQAKRYIKGLVNQLIRGEVARETATAAFMGLNVLARYVELERKLKEQEELVERMDAIEEALEQGRRSKYGA
jgi:hypothetical protein